MLITKMSNAQNDVLWDIAIEKIDKLYAKAILPPEAREALIKEEYEKLMMVEPADVEEEMDDDSDAENNLFNQDEE